MKKLIIKICKWIILKLEPPRNVSKLKKRVKYWVAVANKINTGGSYKKWELVYNQIRKEFPKEKHRLINLLIELELNGL